MRPPNVSVYGSHTCLDTRRTVRFLDSKQIAYEFKDVDQFPEYNDYIAGLNAGKRVMPTVRVNNDVLINPSDDELGDAVGKAAAEPA